MKLRRILISIKLAKWLAAMEMISDSSKETPTSYPRMTFQFPGSMHDCLTAVVGTVLLLH